MSWIQTQSGKRVDLLDPKPSQIDIRDIAYALARLCRFNGHCNQFYSVAEHSVRVMSYVWVKSDRMEIVLQALLHDATEAYLGDMVKPLKEQLPAFQEIENNMERVIFKRFGVPKKMDPLVKEGDLALLATERRDLMGESDHSWGEWLDNITPQPGTIEPWTIYRAEQSFKKDARWLTHALAH